MCGRVRGALRLQVGRHTAAIAHAASQVGQASAVEIEEAAARWAAIQYVHQLREESDGFVHWSALTSFEWDGIRIPLIGASGIWKPAALSVPISITTSPRDPYGDEVDPATGLLRYRYFWTKPGHEDHPFNAGLRQAAREGIPLIYFHGIDKGWYQPLAPVVIVGDDRLARTFTVACDDIALISPDLPSQVAEDVRRTYTTQLAIRRLHQAAFRRRVLTAYADACAVCRLKVLPLLDAAHIVGDRHPLGDPVVPNGLAMCKIHHAAYDQNIIGIRPDSVIEVNEVLLRETDGPMLRHGIQGTHGTSLCKPKSATNRPDPTRLEIRYAEFLKAG